MNNTVFNPLIYSIKFSYIQEDSFLLLKEDFDFLFSIFEKEIFFAKMNNDNSEMCEFYIEFNKNILINETIKEIILDSKFDQILLKSNEIIIPLGLYFKFEISNNKVDVNVNSLGIGNITKEILNKINKSTAEHTNDYKDPFLLYFVNSFNDEIDKMQISNKDLINYLLKFKEYYLERIEFSFFQNKENYFSRMNNNSSNFEENESYKISENLKEEKSNCEIDENTLINNISKLKIRMKNEGETNKKQNITNESFKDFQSTENLNIELITEFNYENFLKIGGFKGDTINDRKSVFQAHAIKLNNPSHVKILTAMLKENKKIGKATHNITAYIINNKNYKDKNSYDDGENKAGERLLELLENMKVTNIFVMVSRWYGGIQLGADRFKHINDSAKNLINKNYDHFYN